MKKASTKRFYFAVTQRCNLHCSHCFNQSGESEETDTLTTDQVCKIVDAACREGYENIQITGGEALLRMDIFEIIDHIHSKNMYLSMQTNGVINTSVVTKLLLLNPKLTEFIVSLDGIQTHSYFRGKSAVQKTIESIRKLSSLFPLRINSLLSAHISRNEITEMIDIARSANASIAFNPISPSGRGKADDMMTCNDYFANMIELQNYADIRIRKGFDYNNGCFNEIEDCPVRKGTAIFVSHNGDCYPCGFLEVHKDLCMGNLVALDYDLNKVFQNYPEKCKIITSECVSCKYYLSKNCFAGCPARIFACSNTFNAREKYCMKEYELITK